MRTQMRLATLHGMPAALLLIGVMLAAGSARAGAWVADAKSGCEVWNPGSATGRSSRLVRVVRKRPRGRNRNRALVEGRGAERD